MKSSNRNQNDFNNLSGWSQSNGQTYVPSISQIVEEKISHKIIRQRKKFNSLVKEKQNKQILVKKKSSTKYDKFVLKQEKNENNDRKQIPKQLTIEKKGKQHIFESPLQNSQFVSYNGLRGVLLSKPLLQIAKNNKKKKKLDYLKRDTLAVLKLIKRERERKLEERLSDQSKHLNRRINEWAIKQGEGNFQQFKIQKGKYSIYQKSIPYKINKGMSQYFPKKIKASSSSDSLNLIK